MTTATHAIIEIRSYYGQAEDLASVASLHCSEAGARTEIDNINDKPYCLEHNQSSVRHEVACVVDDDVDYHTWLDNLDWDGCPSDDGADRDADLQWAEQRALDEGGTLYVEFDCQRLIVEMPAEHAEVRS